MPTVSRPPITPLKLPRAVRHVLVYGGSFDPPHFYHVVAPLMVVNRMYGDEGWVLYVPAARNPQKTSGTSDDHRLAMLRLGLDVPGRRSIWTDELDRAAWLGERGLSMASYTIDTLRRLRSVLPAKVEMRLLIGSDQAANFHTWKDARKVIALAEPLVMARDPILTPSTLWSALDESYWTRSDRRAWCTRFAANFPMDPSSTSAREAIPGAPSDPKKWAKRPGLSNIVTPVARYIIEHNLYGFRSGKPLAASVPARITGDEPGAMHRIKLGLAAVMFETASELIAPPKKRPSAKAKGRRKT